MLLGHTVVSSFGGLTMPFGNASLPALCPVQLAGSSSGGRRHAGQVVMKVANEHMGNLELLYFPWITCG